MVVEMCSGSDVGRYTGFYYTASMAAQVVTPMFSGFLMDKLGMTVLFPYAAIFVAGAFVTMAIAYFVGGATTEKFRLLVTLWTGSDESVATTCAV